MKDFKYELLCAITPKPKYKDNTRKTIDIRVGIYDSKGFNYGNRKGLVIQVHDDTPECFDIRYDYRYTQENELEYVIEFVKEYAHNYLIFNIDKILCVKDILERGTK